MTFKETNIQKITLVDDSSHGWCEFVIDKWKGRDGFTLTIRCGSDTWSYSWGAPGKDWKAFLRQLNFHYLAGKMTTQVFLKDEFIAELKGMLLKERRKEEITQKEARKSWNAIKAAELFPCPMEYLWDLDGFFLTDPYDFPSDMGTPYAFRNMYKRFWNDFVQYLNQDS